MLLLHQLLLMSKNIALPSRLQLVRTLLDHGLVFVLEWAFSYRPATAPLSGSLPSDLSAASSAPSRFLSDHIKNPAVEMLAHALDHDPAAVRQIIINEQERNDEMEGGSTLVVEMIKLLLGEGEIMRERPAGEERLTGVKSQLADALKQLLDTGDGENSSVSLSFSQTNYLQRLSSLLINPVS